MKNVLFSLGLGSNFLCAPADEGDGNGGNSSTTDTGDGDGSTSGDGNGGNSSETDDDDGQSGALSGNGGDDGDDGQVDYKSMTDAEYMKKVVAPTIEGVTLNMEDVTKRYATFCRENGISPEVFSKFLDMEGKYFAEDDKKYAEESKKAAEIKRKNFEAQGAELRKAYTNEQIKSACEVLSKEEFAKDKDFMSIATKELSNNSTLLKLLLNWGEHHKEDAGSGLNNSASDSGLTGFASRWIGRKI